MAWGQDGILVGKGVHPFLWAEMVPGHKTQQRNLLSPASSAGWLCSAKLYHMWQAVRWGPPKTQKCFTDLFVPDHSYKLQFSPSEERTGVYTLESNFRVYICIQFPKEMEALRA